MFVRKTREETINIFESNATIDVLQPGHTVYILKSFESFDEIAFKEIREYQFKVEDPIHAEDEDRT